MEIPKGFRFAGVHCGIKKSAAKEDFALIECAKGAVAAGMYTQNLIFAAPVGLDRSRTPSADIRVIAVNSGNANACTGERGDENAREMARIAAERLGHPAEKALVMSTGIIGVFLPMEKITAGVSLAADKLASDETAFLGAARGILTTDKGTKTESTVFRLGSEHVCIAGMCKGAGMIGPNMATMLGVILTDARLTPSDAQEALAFAVERSFNCISVEGHMSTNDTVLLLASGESFSKPLQGADLSAFRDALVDHCVLLAKQIPDDGEGATHLICVEVEGASDVRSARSVAQTVANSALVKTAIAGGDPNWGRIVSAAGYSGVKFDASKVGLRINGFQLHENGSPIPFDPKTVSTSIRENRETHVLLQIGDGPGGIRFWTSDLTTEYVRFNAEYTT